MTRIVIDDITLMAEPRFLAVADEQFKIYTTKEAFASATAFGSTLKSHRGITDLISRAISLNTVELLDPSVSIRDRVKNLATVSTRSTSVRPVDATVINAALAIKDRFPGDELWVSMYSDDSCRLAHALDLRAGRHNVIVFSLKAAAPHAELGPKVSRFKKERIAYRVAATASLLLLVAATRLALFSYGQILRELTGWPFVLLVPGLGLALYWYKSRFAVHYALAEIAFGCLLGSAVFLKPSSESVDVGTLLQFLASVYVVVRGLDNLGKGIADSRYDDLWRRIF
jgi:hypothetical protein